MNTAQETTECNGKTVASVAPVAQPAPMPEFLSRFLPSVERLDPAERRRLMEACADECRAAYHGQEINWTEVDRINAKIGVTYTRRELISLLNQYRAAIVNGPCS